MRWICCFVLVLCVSCSSYTPPLYKMGDLDTRRAASSMPNSKTKKGLTMGAQLYADGRFCQKFFGLDLVYDGLIPILISLENPKGNNSFEIFPSKMTLTINAGAKRITLRSISIDKCGYSLKVERDVETKTFLKWKLTAGKEKQGFVLFDARKYGWGEAELKGLLKDALLEVPVKKDKLSAKPKKGEKDLSKYRGEKLKFQILFN